VKVPRRVVVVVSVTLIGMAVALSAMAKPTHVKVISACPGVERWRVKTLSDIDVAKVRITKVVHTTVAKLRLTKPSVPIGQQTPRLSTERTVYQVTAQLVEAKVESDGDVHLVIAQVGHPSQMMIVEFPKPECAPESGSPDVGWIDKGRSEFVGLCGTPGSSRFKKLHGLATVTGVGFFDIKHGGVGQTGHAPFNRELHPVIGFSATTC